MRESVVPTNPCCPVTSNRFTRRVGWFETTKKSASIKERRELARQGHHLRGSIHGAIRAKRPARTRVPCESRRPVEASLHEIGTHASVVKQRGKLQRRIVGLLRIQLYRGFASDLGQRSPV